MLLAARRSPEGNKTRTIGSLKTETLQTHSVAGTHSEGDKVSKRGSADGRMQEGLQGTGGGKGTRAHGRAHRRQPCEDSAAALINSHASYIIRLQSSDYDLQQQQQQTARLLWPQRTN